MSKRIDLYLVEKGFAKSRERAKEMVKSGNVSVDGRIVSKPSALVEEDCEIVVTGQVMDYVGRGALKLKHAFECFDIDVKDKYCADIGASTGGFTQIMLEKGAKKVYAVDVGHGQLAKELAEDDRVVNCEGTNVKNLAKDFFDEPIEFVAGDLSFISLKLVIPVVKECVSDGGQMVLLIKPQFEAGKSALNKKGIVKDKKVHVRVLEELTSFFEECGLRLMGLTNSAIKGGDGNIEYLAWLEKSDILKSKKIDIKKLVDTAFNELK
ncbi:MAG: TlyA family RNA methyltransferase [Oscillospiraceae bacterium]